MKDNILNRSGFVVRNIHPTLMSAQDRLEEALGILAIGVTRLCKTETKNLRTDSGNQRDER